MEVMAERRKDVVKSVEVRDKANSEDSFPHQIDADERRFGNQWGLDTPVVHSVNNESYG